jgi:large subunit ribosomal protein L3
MKGILGKKVGMTQIFDDKGEVIPVTVIEAGPCFVTQKKTLERDGYTAIQVGMQEAKPKHLTKGQLGHLEKAKLPPLRHLREIRLSSVDEYEVGQRLTVAMFESGEQVDVVGTSKGRGFAGAIKRHGFKRQPKTHGQSDRERAPGSIGAMMSPSRVFKGTRMAGHMGVARVTAQNLRVVLVDEERNLLAVNGSVPGANGGLVLIKQSRKS